MGVATERRPGGEEREESLATLQAGTPAGVDPARKEQYLSTEAFEAEFGMPRAEFDKLPQWKRNAAKKKAGIF